MIQTALQWLYDNLYSYMIPVCALCVLRIAVCLMELGHVRRLREKIEDNPASPVYILTRRGVGYYFAAQG